MSAIYGAIDLNRNAIDKDLPARFDAGYTKCKIDKNNSLLKDNVYMHCGVQYFYPRAKAEKLPFYDEESNIYITADCVIDNRKELLPELGLEATAPDGDIIFAAYKKWGKECCKHLQGLFSFVIYDAGKNEIFAAVDQFAQRCLFYHVRDGVFYFSTLFFPIPEATGLKFEENERWLVDAISLRSPAMMTEPKETALLHVDKIVSGTYILIEGFKDSDSKIVEQRYYDPYNEIPTDWSITVEQSEKMVKDTMFSVIDKILEEQGNVAAELSSGLDSSAVACVAANILSEKDKDLRIYSFTSVPIKEAGLEDTRFTCYDETDGVKVICKKYPNIEPTFFDCHDKDYLCCAEEIVDGWELPCKSQQNAIWMDELNKLAADKGCKILLNGSSGNCTISAGDYDSVAYYYFTHFRFIKAYHMFDIIKKMGGSRKLVLKAIVREWLDYFRWYYKNNTDSCYQETVTNKVIGEKYNYSKRFNKEFSHYFPFKTMNLMRKEMYALNANAQIGEINVKDSLLYGILPRDPMKTVEFMDLCLRLPIYCFAQSDYDRRLVRKGMEGIVPEDIRNNIFRRGRQSGDNIYRIKRSWGKIKNNWNEVIGMDAVGYFLDKDKSSRFRAMVNGNIEDVADKDLILLGYIYSFGIFVNKLQKFIKN